jgi:hypothetical protein
MNKALKNTLEQLSQDQLIHVIEKAHGSNKICQTIIEQSIAAYNPKELYKLTNKAITGIKNSTRFIGYRESYEFAEKLNHINEGIEELVAQAPDLAIKLCQRVIEIDGSICERVDDSSGFLSDFYITTYSLLDRAFVAAKSDALLVGNYLYEVYSHDEYGIRGYILENAKKSLRAGADNVLENLLASQPLADYANLNALKTIADARGDVDAYIGLVKQDEQRIGRPLSGGSICEIAKRLNAEFRSEEAISWLGKIDQDSHHYSQKIQLLVEAYLLEGNENKARELLWERFERYLHADDYLAYLKRATAVEKETAQCKAIELAKKCTSLDSTLAFLENIQVWDEVDDIIINHAKANTLNNGNYSLYRKLSTSLTHQGKGLSAVLLRRALVDDVLYKAQSKYYHYAASDLKKAHDFSKTVTDWKGFATHQSFIQTLQTQHARKYAFWSKVGDHGDLLKSSDGG